MWANSFREILPHWELADSFTAIEAAALIAGVEPTSIDESLEYFKNKQSGLTVSNGIHEFTAALNIMLSAIRSGSLKADGNTGRLKEISVERSDLVEWISSKGKRFRPAFFFPNDTNSVENDPGRLHQLEVDNARLVEQVAELQRQLQEATAAAKQAPKGDGKPLSTKERQTLLKLVGGMAMACHGHDPDAKRSGTASEIASDLAEIGVSVDVDTVRKYLKEAAETVLPAKAMT